MVVNSEPRLLIREGTPSINAITREEITRNNDQRNNIKVIISIFDLIKVIISILSIQTSKISGTKVHHFYIKL